MTRIIKISDVAGGTPEGTAVKSTGETGGAKFLREDGDGTCSWQTPSSTPTVATGSEVDTGTNNDKMVTPKAMEDSSYAKTTAIPTALSSLSDDTTHRLVTDTEKTTWNNKTDQSFVIAMAVAL